MERQDNELLPKSPNFPKPSTRGIQKKEITNYRAKRFERVAMEIKLFNKLFYEFEEDTTNQISYPG